MNRKYYIAPYTGTLDELTNQDTGFVKVEDVFLKVSDMFSKKVLENDREYDLSVSLPKPKHGKKYHLCITVEGLSAKVCEKIATDFMTAHGLKGKESSEVALLVAYKLRRGGSFN